MTSETMERLSEQLAEERGTACALICGARDTNFAELHAQVLRAVAALRSLGVKKGDRIGYLALNTDDYVVLFLAAMRMGVVVVAVNWRLVAREIAYILNDAGISVLITETQFLAQAEDANADAPYMYHCHILEHEDCGMMGQFTVT